MAESNILNRAPISREGREQLRRENGFRNTRWYECSLGHRFGLVLETLPDGQHLSMGDLGCPYCSDGIRPDVITEVENDGGRQY